MQGLVCTLHASIIVEEVDAILAASTDSVAITGDTALERGIAGHAFTFIVSVKLVLQTT